MPEISTNIKSVSENSTEKLQESISELLETEKTYVSRLMTTYKIYIIEAQSILSENDRNRIFSNLEEILIANDNFLQELLKNFNNGQGIGQTFLNHIPNFSVYLVYCRNQTSSIKYLQRKMKDQALLNYIKESLFKPECNGLDLASFLLEPVQRLTRYPMLLKQIQKYTRVPSEECNLLAISIEECENLLERVNKSMLEGEEYEKLAQLQRRLSGNGRLSNSFNSEILPENGGKLPANLAGLTRNYGERKLLKTGLWLKLRSRKKLLIFLFSDFLLMTEASVGETNLQILEDEDSKLKIYRKAIHLDDIWLMKEAESSKIPHQFQNCPNLRPLELEVHDSPPILFHLSSDEFENWINLISIAKRKLKITAPLPTNNQQKFNSNNEDSIGSIRIKICSSSDIDLIIPDDQFYIRINSGTLDQSFTTNPARGPIPVWNQIFTLPIRNFDSEIKFELLKYDQYKVNESFGEFNLSLEFLEGFCGEKVIETFSLESVNGGSSALKLKIEFIPKGNK